jgi:hypothetical protein
MERLLADIVCRTEHTQGNSVMRKFCVLLSAAALLSGSAFAADTGSSALAPGKPAGMRAAQDRDNTIVYIVGLGAIAAGVALIASGSSDNGKSSNPPATTPSTQ